ncbi:MAG: hypothetical protein K0R41_2607 [Geminicoccaceae bacterium]|jgi:hypothetical protein|nr:hypothetical protein [Geminicoccaceae bacterium]MCE3248782.1 hypothetical protein [Geminicoccaceae bacterium]
MRALLLPLVGDDHDAAACTVMGGCGHSRARELILGGATRHVPHDYALPVAIAH